MLEFVVLGNASVSKAFTNFTATPMKVLGTGWFMAYYFFNKKQSKIQAMKFSNKPDFEIQKMIWNLMDAKGIKTMMKVAMPGIKFRKNLYLLKTAKILDFDFLDKLFEKSETVNFHQMKDYNLLDENYLKTINKENNDNNTTYKKPKMIIGELIRESVDDKNHESKYNKI